MKSKESDLEFIKGIIYESFDKHLPVPVDGSIKDQYCFKITKGEEFRVYDIFQYLDLILEAQYNEADKTKSYYKKIICIANAESSIKRKISQYNLNQFNIDFSVLFDDIQFTEKRLNAYYQGSEKWRFFWAGGVLSFSVAILSGLLILWMTTQNQKQPLKVETTIQNIPKIQMIHDTIYIKN